ncbi:nuclear factor erythroid 2-related factor 2 [Stemphylium lycopersici]|nr:nuclear factor erythroid 2-related factor 2 [Stemphylium lycopersici]RAR02163.1 nuclear factor erythroid 2-related factor 2 [Stemphylium lycopersici]
MHRKNPISVLVYNTLFPTPSPTDPPSFSAHLSKNLVGEVRIETANFYGSLDTIEARYPGLNYAFQPHRKRLGRFPHHKRLFEAFDRLGLTEAEIQGFCRWEGTLWARERYERDEGVRVVDTTGVEIGAWVDTRWRYSHHAGTGGAGINVKTDIEVEIEQLQHQQRRRSSRRQSQTNNNASSRARNNNNNNNTQQGDTEMPDSSSSDNNNNNSGNNAESSNEDEDDEEESDDDDEDAQLSSSVGFSLNARLLHAAALRESSAANGTAAVAMNIPMDPEWEQYLKEASERGELNIDATREALRSMAGQIAQLHQSTVEAEGSEAVPQSFQPPAAPA